MDLYGTNRNVLWDGNEMKDLAHVPKLEEHVNYIRGDNKGAIVVKCSGKCF